MNRLFNRLRWWFFIQLSLSVITHLTQVHPEEDYCVTSQASICQTSITTMHVLLSPKLVSDSTLKSLMLS